MLKKIINIGIAVLLVLTACKKGTLVEEVSYGMMEFELIGLPGTSKLAIYMEGIKLADSLGGITEIKTQLLPAGKKTKISFRIAGSDEAVLDTGIVMEGGKKMTLRIAFSEELGIKSFLGNKSSLSTDSVSFQVFNKLPEGVQANGVSMDAVLFKLNNTTGEFDELTTFQNFQRLKLHPKSVAVPLKDSDGMEIYYLLKFKNTQTGEFTLDGSGSDYMVLGFITPGKEHILMTEASELVNTAGNTVYYFNVVPVEL
jgi:hypothetical protein